MDPRAPSDRTLHLQRPLVFFDLETTGLDVERDRIVELGFVKLMPDGERQTRSRRIHPGVPIPPEATAVHGISDADVADCPTFSRIAKDLHTWLSGCDLGGYNVERFDMPLLAAEFRRVQLAFPAENTLVVDAYRIFAQREGRDLTSAYRFYCAKELQGAHSAEADILATVEVLQGQLERYLDLPTDISGLHAVCHPIDPNAVDSGGRLIWRNAEAVVSFGKHRGRTLREMSAQEPGYLRWLISGDFATDLKDIATQALRGVFPVRPMTEPRDATSSGPGDGPAGQS